MRSHHVHEARETEIVANRCLRGFPLYCSTVPRSFVASVDPGRSQPVAAGWHQIAGRTLGSMKDLTPLGPQLADPAHEAPEIPESGFVGPELLGRDHIIEADLEPPAGGREVGAIDVREHDQLEVPFQVLEGGGRIDKYRPLGHRLAEQDVVIVRSEYTPFA